MAQHPSRTGRGGRWIHRAAAAGALGLVLGFSASAWGATNPGLSGSIADPVHLSGATAVAVSGSFAYTTAAFAGRVTAMDISNPASPVVAGQTAMAPSLLDAATINVANGYAYVVSKNRNGAKGSNSNDDGTGNSLTIVDIHTNPAQPTIVGHLTDAANLFGAYGIAVSGNFAYIAAQGCLSSQPCPNPTAGNSFAVVDVSNPAQPRLVATLHNGALPAQWAGTNALDHPTAVAVSGNFALVTAAYSNRLTVIDVSSPTSPTIVASLLDPTRLAFPVDVAVAGHYAYVANQGSLLGLSVVDVATPSSPSIVGTVTNGLLNGAYRIRLHGNFAYISASSALALATIDISDPTSPRVAAGYYDPARLWSTTGLEIDASGRYAITTSPYLSTESYPLYPPFPGQTGGPTQTGTVSVIALDPMPISVAIQRSTAPPNPTQQSTASFAFATNDAVATVRCQLDGMPFGLCTSAGTQHYSALGLGSHVFAIQAIDSAGNVATASYQWTVAPPSSVPVSTQPPAIAGTAALGSILTASNGTWSGTPPPTFTYQWQRCNRAGATCVAVPGATAPTYTLTRGETGSTVKVVVTATNTAGSNAALSSATAVVSGGRLSSTGRPGPLFTAFRFAGRTLSIKLSAAARMNVKAQRCQRVAVRHRRHARPRTVCKAVARFSARSTHAGTLRVVVPARLPAGRYRLVVQVTDSAHHRSKVVTLNVVVSALRRGPRRPQRPARLAVSHAPRVA